MKFRGPRTPIAVATLLLVSACSNNPHQPPQVETGPTRAEVAIGYPFDLLTHCGVTYATFSGRTWKVEQPVPDPAGEPFSRGAVNYLSGEMQLVAEDELRFTVDDDSEYVPGIVVTFRPTTETVPLCH